MEKVIIHSLEILLFIGLLFGVIKYWSWKLGKGYDISLQNRSYGLFMGMQLLTLTLMMFLSTDSQNAVYLESYTMVGTGASEYWSYLGVHMFGLVFLLMIANVIGHLMYMITLKEELSLYEEIMEDHLTPAMVASLVILISGLVLSTYLLKPYLFDWISDTQKIIPMI